jgi:hypothetical protein
MRARLVPGFLTLLLLAAAPAPPDHWTGVLPTSSGAPAQTELVLYPGLSGFAGHFRWSEAAPPSGGNYAPRVATGTWSRLRGSDIFQLVFSRPGPIRNFLLAGDGSLRELDRQLQPLASLDSASYALFPIFSESPHPLELRPR